MPLLTANLISEWRRALVSELQTAFPGAEVTSGRRAGVSRELRIAVFFDGHRETPDRVVVARTVMIVRYWPAHAADTPADPSELEQAAYDLMRLLQDRQKQIELAVDDLWFFRVESVVTDEDPEEWGVEARLLGFAKNVAAIA
ncbi:MAG: hypothetical protein H0U82_06995 [Actinobacteria bacterium]|nr:hypothetical protein [Actinomycetota bacterium]